MATRKKNRSSRNAQVINRKATPEKRTPKLKGREALGPEERFRELAAWYMLQGMDEATARQRAGDQMRDE